MPLPCSDCTVNIGLFKKKHTCGNCLGIYCGRCFTKTSRMKLPQTVSPRNCLKCNIFCQQIYRREDLFLLNTRDLRYFLTSRNVSTKDCTEKFHFVDLIMNFAERSGQKSVTDLRREQDQRAHVESLRQAAQRMQEEESRESTQEDFSFREEITERNLPGTPMDNTPTTTTFTQHSNKLKSIEDITSLSEIDSLGVKDLKKILVINCIDYKGCLERKELIEKVKRLWTAQKKEGEETVAGSDQSSSYDENLCKICLDAQINCVLLDCGHFLSCTKCGRKLAECPVCRQLIVRIVHVFRA